MPRCYGYRQTPGARKLPATPRPLRQQPFCHSSNQKRKLRDPCASTHKPRREHLEEENRDPTAITGLAGSTGNGLIGTVPWLGAQVLLRTLVRWGTQSDRNTSLIAQTGRAGSISQGLHCGADGLVHRGEFCGPAVTAAGAGAGRRSGGAQVGLTAGPRASVALLSHPLEPV